MDLTKVRWRKAARSGGNNECVELAHTLKAIRDSKSPRGVALVVDAGGLLLAVKSGHFDR